MIWTEAERRAWALPEKITVTEWAARNRVLSTKESNEPGPYAPDRTPYMKAVMNACADPGIDQVVFLKPTQIGGSEAFRNAFGYWVDQDPGPVIFVMPDEKAAKKNFGDRILPMMRRTPALRRHMTPAKRDVTKYHVELNNALVRIGWAGSPQSLASDPYRYVVFDETDKYPPFSGDDADPISLGERRATTFQDRKMIVKLSTPTTRQGYIWREWEASPCRLVYHVPCPHCKAYQVLDWQRVKWDKVSGEERTARADRIERDQSAWYACAHCEEWIGDRHKLWMNARGMWAEIDIMIADNPDDAVGRNGILWPENKPPRRVAFRVSALYSPWLTFSDVAVEGIRSMGNAVKQMSFRNNFLAEVYEQEVTAIRTRSFDDKIAAGHKPLIVPAWAGLLIAAVDTQKDHFWFTIRAWGEGSRSRLIQYGRVDSFDDLRRVCLDAAWPVEGPEDEKISLRARMLFMDAGGGRAPDDAIEKSRTHQVYRFAETDSRIMALHGHGGERPMAMPLMVRRHTYTPPDESESIKTQYLRIDTEVYKDVLSSRIKMAAGASDSWEIHAEVGPDYLLQMASEHKILHRRGASQQFIWTKITAGAENHLWDCEVYQCAAADYLHVATVPPAAELAKSRAHEARARTETEQGITDQYGRPFLITDR